MAMPVTATGPLLAAAGASHDPLRISSRMSTSWPRSRSSAKASVTRSGVSARSACAAGSKPSAVRKSKMARAAAARSTAMILIQQIPTHGSGERATSREACLQIVIVRERILPVAPAQPDQLFADPAVKVHQTGLWIFDHATHGLDAGPARFVALDALFQVALELEHVLLVIRAGLQRGGSRTGQARQFCQSVFDFTLLTQLVADQIRQIRDQRVDFGNGEDALCLHGRSSHRQSKGSLALLTRRQPWPVARVWGPCPRRFLPSAAPAPHFWLAGLLACLFLSPKHSGRRPQDDGELGQEKVRDQDGDGDHHHRARSAIAYP